MSASAPSVEQVIAQLPAEQQQQINRILFGKPVEMIPIPASVTDAAKAGNFEVACYRTPCTPDTLQPARKVRIAVIQNQIVLPTTEPLDAQYKAIEARVEKLLDAAAGMGANVVCLQEAWTAPFFFCTREKRPWCELAEDCQTGPAFQFISRKAKQHNMVIVSPILERDTKKQGIIWNAAVVVGNNGNFIGRDRKNHIPRVGDFNESTYYFEGDCGHPVFETKFGRIGVNICYGRHHPLNWMMFGLNGAEIVFNPSATVGGLSEPLWGIEARNASIAHSYFVGAVNRVGTEVFPNEFTSGDAKPAHKDFGHFFGSSYVANPDGSRTPGLCRDRDGVLVNEVDLNMCMQVKDRWTFQMTARYPLYAEGLARYIRPDFEPQRIVDPALTDSKPMAPPPAKSMSV